MATFLFVHGAFQGGWVWQKVASVLHDKGHEVHTPTLSGCGYLAKDSRQEDDLNSYVADILNYIDFENLDEIILVAHSFSGMICGAVMMQIPHLIKHAIFVDAIIPETEQSFAETAGEIFQIMLDTHLLNDMLVKPWPLNVFGVSGPSADWFEHRLRPFPYQAFQSPFPGSFDPHRVGSSYISCLQTTSPFSRGMSKKVKEYLWPSVEIDTGHCPMVTSPADLTRLIMMLGTSGYDFRSFFE